MKSSSKMGLTIGIGIFMFFIVLFLLSASTGSSIFGGSGTGGSSLFEKGKQVECNVQIYVPTLDWNPQIGTTNCEVVGNDCIPYNFMSFFSYEGKILLIGNGETVDSKDYDIGKIATFDKSYTLDGCIPYGLDTLSVKLKDDEGNVLETKEVSL